MDTLASTSTAAPTLTPISVTQPTYTPEPVATPAPVSAPAPVATPAPTTPSVASTISSVPLTPAAPALAPISATPAVKPVSAPKPKATNLREQTTGAQDDYMAYIENVKTGNDPITNKMMNDLFKAQNASGQRNMDSIQQQLAVSGQLGTGAGNAMVSKMARDMGISNSELASKMSAQALDRIERFNQLGFETATKIEQDENQYIKDRTEWALQQGDFAGAQQIYNENAERTGLPPMDLSSPQAATRFKQEWQTYSQLEKELYNEYEASNDYDAYVKRWNELRNSNTAFANHAGSVPKSKNSLVEAQYAQNRNSAVTNSLSTAKTLAASGDKTGSAKAIAQMYGSSGPLGSLGLNGAEVAKTYEYMTASEQSLVTSATQHINTLATHGSTPAELQAYAQMISKQIPDSQFFKDLASKGDFTKLLADADGYGARQLANKEADKVITNLGTLDSANPALMAQQKLKWQQSFKASKTEAELLADIKASGDPVLIAGINGNPQEKTEAIQDYLDNTWATVSDAGSPAGVKRAAVNNTLATLEKDPAFDSKGMTQPQRDAVAGVISQFYSNDADAAKIGSGTDIIKAHPELQLAFTDFNGNDIDSISPADRAVFNTEKSYYDQVASLARSKNEVPMTAQEFDAVYDYLGISSTNTFGNGGQATVTQFGDAAADMSPATLARLKYFKTLTDSGASQGDAFAMLASSEAKPLPVGPSTKRAFLELGEDTATDLVNSLGIPPLNISIEQEKEITDGKTPTGIKVASDFANRPVLVAGVPYYCTLVSSGSSKMMRGSSGALVPAPSSGTKMLFTPVNGTARSPFALPVKD